MRNNTNNKFKFSIVLWTLCLLSIYIGFVVYRNFGVVARGISGVALLLLIFYYINNSGLERSLEQMKSGEMAFAPIVIAALIIPFLSWVASIQIYEMLRALFE